MKHPQMKLVVDILSEEQEGYVHQAGATGIVVEPLGPNAWIIEVRVPDTTLEGDAWYETFHVYGHEFELLVGHPPETRA